LLAECRPSPAVCKAQLKAGKRYSHRQRGLILGLNGELTWGPMVDELAGPVRARLAFQTLCEVTAAAQAGSQPAPSACLVGLFVSPARCSQAVAARAAAPPYAGAGRSTVQLTFEPATPPGVAQPGAGWISGPAYEYHWQADAIARGRGRPLFGARV
jgi:hypothetical protein